MQKEAKRMQKKPNELNRAIVLIKTYSVTRPANVAETQLPPHQSDKSKPTPKREMLKSIDNKAPHPSNIALFLDACGMTRLSLD